MYKHVWTLWVCGCVGVWVGGCFSVCVCLSACVCITTNITAMQICTPPKIPCPTIRAQVPPSPPRWVCWIWVVHHSRWHMRTPTPLCTMRALQIQVEHNPHHNVSLLFSSSSSSSCLCVSPVILLPFFPYMCFPCHHAPLCFPTVAVPLGPVTYTLRMVLLHNHGLDSAWDRAVQALLPDAQSEDAGGAKRQQHTKRRGRVWCTRAG